MEKVYENCVALYNYYTYLVLFVHINIYTPLYKFMLVRKLKNISPRIQSQRFLASESGNSGIWQFPPYGCGGRPGQADGSTRNDTNACPSPICTPTSRLHTTPAPYPIDAPTSDTSQYTHQLHLHLITPTVSSTIERNSYTSTPAVSSTNKRNKRTPGRSSSQLGEDEVWPSEQSQAASSLRLGYGDTRPHPAYCPATAASTALGLISQPGYLNLIFFRQNNHLSSSYYIAMFIHLLFIQH